MPAKFSVKKRRATYDANSDRALAEYKQSQIYRNHHESKFRGRHRHNSLLRNFLMEPLATAAMVQEDSDQPTQASAIPGTQMQSLNISPASQVKLLSHMQMIKNSEIASKSASK